MSSCRPSYYTVFALLERHDLLDADGVFFLGGEVTDGLHQTSHGEQSVSA